MELSNVPVIYFDFEQIEQVILNISINATTSNAKWWNINNTFSFS